MNVQIKPLDWDTHSVGMEKAESILGRYVVEQSGIWWLGLDGQMTKSGESIDAAKAAAQAHYETRILSALISSPGKDGGQEVDAVAWHVPGSSAVTKDKHVTDRWRFTTQDIQPLYTRPQPASTAPAELWDGPIEELSRAKAGRFYDVAKEHPNCALGEREAYVNKNWQNWREDAAIEVANLSQPASTALVEALEPFSKAAGELYARNWNASQVVMSFSAEDGIVQLTARDFFAARAALSVPAAAAVGEPGPMQHVRAHAHLVRCFAEEMTARNWADKALYIKQQADFIISAIDAAPSSPEGWQPIETAPKDGTVIMAWHTVHDCPMAVVWKEPGHPFNGEVLNWYEKSYTTAWPEKCFSHWKPLLPAPPALGGKP